MEHPDTGIGVLRLTLDAHIEIEGFLGLQVGIALKPPAHLCLTDADGGAAVHLPVVPELAHARLCVARADVRLEAEMRIAADVVRHADAAGEIRTKEVAVIDTQDGEEHRVLRELPCVADKEVLLVDRTAADGEALVAIPILFEEHLPVERGRVWIVFVRALNAFFIVIADNIGSRICRTPMTRTVLIFKTRL